MAGMGAAKTVTFKNHKGADITIPVDQALQTVKDYWGSTGAAKTNVDSIVAAMKARGMSFDLPTAPGKFAAQFGGQAAAAPAAATKAGPPPAGYPTTDSYVDANQQAWVYQPAGSFGGAAGWRPLEKGETWTDANGVPTIQGGSYQFPQTKKFSLEEWQAVPDEGSLAGFMHAMAVPAAAAGAHFLGPLLSGAGGAGMTGAELTSAWLPEAAGGSTIGSLGAADWGAGALATAADAASGTKTLTDLQKAWLPEAAGGSAIGTPAAADFGTAASAASAIKPLTELEKAWLPEAAGGSPVGTAADAAATGAADWGTAASAAAAAAKAATTATDAATKDKGALGSLADLVGGSSNLELLGKLLGTGLGLYGADQAGKDAKALADKFDSYGAPYRQKLSDLYADPSKYLNSAEVQKPVQQGTDIMARSLSTQGNPTGSGRALQQIQSYASDQLYGKLGQEKDRLAGFGGLSAYNQAAPAAAATAATQGNQGLNVLGAGIADIFSPPKQYQSLYDLLNAGRRP